jgi:membrane protein YqaA with SNARE-associated domain
MNGLEWSCFIALAILCNTALPIPFDPVLIVFGAGHGFAGACVIAVIGSLCASVGAVADIKLGRGVHRRVSEKWFRLMPYWTGWRAYVLFFLFAFLPLPFSVVRLAVVRNPPRLVPYQIAVTLGRLPRYLLAILLSA